MDTANQGSPEKAPASPQIQSEGGLDVPLETESVEDHTPEEEGSVSGTSSAASGGIEKNAVNGIELADSVEDVEDDIPRARDVIEGSNCRAEGELEESGLVRNRESAEFGSGEGDSAFVCSVDVLGDSNQEIVCKLDPEHHATIVCEMKKMQDILEDTLTQTHNILSKIEGLSYDTADFSKRLAAVSELHDALTQEMGSISAESRIKSTLSKTFLIVSSVVLVLLVVFQVYTFVSLIKIQRLQNAAGASLLGNVNNLTAKLTDFDKKIAQALEKTVQREHSPPTSAMPETTDSDAHGTGDAGSTFATPVAEKLNRLRNGLPEKKLIRKETGDWFIYSKKGSENIADVDVIRALNEAYTKIGRSMTTKIPLPAHNAVCLLKPDGKGGTLVVMTGDFLP